MTNFEKLNIGGRIVSTLIEDYNKVYEDYVHPDYDMSQVELHVELAPDYVFAMQYTDVGYSTKLLDQKHLLDDEDIEILKNSFGISHDSGAIEIITDYLISVGVISDDECEYVGDSDDVCHEFIELLDEIHGLKNEYFNYLKAEAAKSVSVEALMYQYICGSTDNSDLAEAVEEIEKIHTDRDDILKRCIDYRNSLCEYFHGCFLHDDAVWAVYLPWLDGLDNGDEYFSENERFGWNEDGDEIRMVWSFPEVKGVDTCLSEINWDDEKFVTVEVL